MSEANKVKGQKSKVGTHGSCVRAPKPQRLNDLTIRRLVDSLSRSDFVSAMHSKPTLFAAFLLFLAKNAMSALLFNAFFLRLSYAKMYLRSITMSFHCIASTIQRFNDSTIHRLVDSSSRSELINN